MSIKRAAAWCLVLIAMLWLVFLGRAEEGGPVVATWKGGRLERADYESWRSFHQLEDDPATIYELAFVESMAALARERGVEQELSFQLEVEAMRQKVLVPPLHERIDATVAVSDAELEALRRQYPDAFQRPLRVKLRNIYKSLGSDPEARRARMAEIHAELVAGADFKKLAAAESESQSRFRDGHLGFLKPDKLPPEVGAVVRELKPGEISGVVEHGNGLSIFLCEDVREAEVPTPSEVSDKLRQNLVRQRRQEAWSHFQDELLQAGSLKIDPAAKTTVLALEGYQLSAQALAELVRLRAGKALSDVSLAQREQMLWGWAFGVLAVRHAVELGLDRDPALATALRWRHLGLLAHRELVWSIDERLREPTAEELQRHFAANARSFRERAAFDLAVIHFGDKKAAAEKQLYQLANDVANRLAAGELSFEEAARRYSIHPSAASGGAIGWRTRPQIADWGPVASSALRKLEPGQQSGLLHLESGLWIFALRGERAARQLTFEEVADQVRELAREEQIHELESVIRDERLREIEVEIREGS